MNPQFFDRQTPCLYAHHSKRSDWHGTRKDPVETPGNCLRVTPMSHTRRFGPTAPKRRSSTMSRMTYCAPTISLSGLYATNLGWRLLILGGIRVGQSIPQCRSRRSR